MPASHDGTVPTASPAARLDGAPRETTLPGGEYIRERFDDGKRDMTRPPVPVPLGVPIYDNHTHLEIKDGEDFPYWAALDAAEQAGVAGVIQVGGDVESSEWSAALADRAEVVHDGGFTEVEPGTATAAFVRAVSPRT